MNYRHIGLMLSVMLAGTACEKANSVTSPPPPVATATPTPGPVAQLAGPWRGTLELKGLTDVCFDRSGEITVDIAQSGSQVTFSIHVAGRCSQAGLSTFEGSLAGNQLTGTMRLPATPGTCDLLGRIEGSADSNQIALDGHMSGCDNAVIVHVRLSR